jgi:hypothetical protein
MRRCRSRRIFAIVLVLTRLMLADFLHLPAAHATAHDTTQTMMMAGEPCPGMGGVPSPASPSPPHVEHPVPINDGGCCKSSQCPCLHAPALMVALPVPAVVGIGYAGLSPGTVQHLSGPPAVFFRPPI